MAIPFFSLKKTKTSTQNPTSFGSSPASMLSGVPGAITPKTNPNRDTFVKSSLITTPNASYAPAPSSRISSAPQAPAAGASFASAGYSLPQAVVKKPVTPAAATFSAPTPAAPAAPTTSPAYDQLLAERARTDAGVSQKTPAATPFTAQLFKPDNASSTTPPAEAMIGGGTRTAAKSPEQVRADEARARFLATMAPDAALEQQKRDLADFQANVSRTVAGEAGQGRERTADLVRGRQAGIVAQNAIEEANRIANLNVSLEEKKNAQTLALTELGFAQDDVKAITDQAKPFEFDGDLVRYDQATGELVTIKKAAPMAGESFTLNPGEVRYDSSGNVVAIAPEKPVDALAQQKQMLEIQKLQNELNGGSATLNELLTVKELQDLGLPTNLYGMTRGQAAQALSSGSIQTGADQQAQSRIATLQDKLSLIDSLLADKSGIQGAVGTGLLSRGSLLTGRQANFKASVDQLINQEVLNTLIDLKAQGGTLGALSEKELSILQGAASKINSWEIKDGNGNGTGRYRVKEADFRKELENMKQSTQRVINAAAQSSGLGYAGQGDELDGVLDGIIGGSFSNDPSKSQNGSALAIANAIKKVESGGNYNARGGSGEGGAYQFMPNTWSSWAKQYLGSATAPQTPENQDFVAQSKVQDLLNQGYGPKEIALIWNGGQPIVKKGVNRFGVAYDSGAYANKVLGALQA